MKKAIDRVEIELYDAEASLENGVTPRTWYYLALALIHLFADLVDVLWKIYNKAE